MADLSEFPVGTRVKFQPFPGRGNPVEAEITAHEKGWLVTKDATGKQRKTRPHNCTKV